MQRHITISCSTDFAGCENMAQKAYNQKSPKYAIMKKSVILCLCMTVVFLFTACNKEQDGIYNPSRKIQKIHTVLNAPLNAEELQDLVVVWNWDGDVLSSIDFYENEVLTSTNQFTYEGNRLTTVRNASSYANFSYDEEKIDEIKVYLTEYDEPFLKYSFEHRGGKVSEIEVEYHYIAGLDKKALVDPLTYILPQSCEPAAKMIAERAKEVKGYEKATMKLTWIGGNVTSVKTVSESDMSNSSNSYVTRCTFDNKENPMKSCIALFAFGNTNSFMDFCNKNNILTTVTSTGSLSKITTTYVYEYNGDYPTKVTSIDRIDDVEKEGATTYYEYK